MDEGGGILLGPWAGLGFGGTLGLAIGYTTKKVGKLVLLAIGVVVLILQALSYFDLIAIDWGAIQAAAAGVWETSDGTLADSAWALIRHNLPLGGGFLAGFAVGFQMG